MFKKKKKLDIITRDSEFISGVKLHESDNETDFKNIENHVEGNFTFYDIDNDTDCAVDEVEIVQDDKINTRKKDLISFFEDSKRDNSKIKEDHIKSKKKSKRQIIKEIELSNIKNQKMYVFRNKKFIVVDDFIKYLDSHYLEIDKIAGEVLNDELFHGWIRKNSGIFEESITLFKEIKDKIEKK